MLYACKGAHTLFTSQSEKKRERERERELERKRERDIYIEYVQNCYFYFKRNNWVP
jgi:hypothetical protein